MGRFSKLETAQPLGNQSPEKVDRGPLELGAGYPTAPDDASSQQVLDMYGCLREGDRALFQGETKSALRWYARAMDLEPKALNPWLSTIRALMLRGEIREAYTWITRGLAIFNEQPELLALRAVQYARRGMVRQGMANSDAVLERNGSLALAHLARGEVLLVAGNKNAEFCFDQCLKLTPVDDWHTPMIIGLIFKEQRQWSGAIKYFARVAERNERLPELWYHVGQCRAQLGHTAQAAKAFEQAQEFCAPGDPFLRHIRSANPKGPFLAWFRGLFKGVNK